MKQIVASFLVLAVAVPASAGPLARDAAAVAKETAQNAQKAPGKNRYLWPSVALIGGGTAMALVGFLHTTRHSIGPVFLTPQVLAANPYLQEQPLLVMGTSSHNTALGVAGIGVAGFGAVLFAIGQKQKRAQPSISLRPGAASVAWSVRF